MTGWLVSTLAAHPEIAFFLILGLGYLLGKIALGGFALGAVTGTLLAGVLVGQLGITLPNEVKQCFFLLFLFAIGFRTGPQFFRGLRSDGLTHAALAVIVATVGLVVAYVVSLGFGYDAGTAAGLVAGALTESATIGTAMDAISHLRCDRSRARTAMTNNIPVAFAVTYLVGVTAASWVLSQLGPKLLRVDLAAECRKLEDEMLGSEPAPMPARREIELRAYAVERGGRWAGRRVAALELAAAGERLFVERIRSRGRIFPGDTAVDSSGRRRRGDLRAAHDARRGSRAERQRVARDRRQRAARPAGRAPRRRRYQCGDRRPDARGSRRGGAGARCLPQTNHTRGPTARSTAGIARVPRRRAHDRRRRGECRAGRAIIWAWQTARPTSPTCSSSPPRSSPAR